MISFNEFVDGNLITESYIDAKNWANANLSGFGRDDAEKARFYKELATGGFTNRNDAGKAWKSLLVHDEGVFGPAKKAAKAPPAKAAKPEAKGLSVLDKFETSTILKKYAELTKLLNEIRVEGTKISKEFEKRKGADKISGDGSSPEYLRSVASANAKYVDDIQKIVNDRVSWIKKLS